MRFIIKWVIPIIIALAIGLGIRFYVVEAVHVKGESMLPTFEDGDITFIFKRMNPKKGDVVFLESPNDEKVVKRLVATEGDTVKFTDKEVFVNGEKEDRYEDLSRTMVHEYTIEKDEMYVLGDNINHSTDSRMTYYTTDDYMGKAIFYIRDFKIKRIAD